MTTGDTPVPADGPVPDQGRSSRSGWLGLAQLHPGLVVSGAYFAATGIGWVSRGVRAGNVPMVEVQLASGLYDGRDAAIPFETGMLGATTAWVFLYDPGAADGEGRTTAVPVENVVSLTPLPSS